MEFRFRHLKLKPNADCALDWTPAMHREGPTTPGPCPCSSRPVLECIDVEVQGKAHTGVTAGFETAYALAGGLLVERAWETKSGFCQASGCSLA